MHTQARKGGPVAVLHVNRVKAFLRSTDAEGITPAERLVLLLIAEGIYTDRSDVSNRDDWNLGELVGLGHLKRILQRLARRGLEVRVAQGVTAGGRPMYAFQGRQVVYRLPDRVLQVGTPVPPSSPQGGTGVPSQGTGVPSQGTAVPSQGTGVPPSPDTQNPRPPEGVSGEGSPMTEDPEQRRAVELVDQLQHRQGVGRLKPDGRRRLVEAMERARGRGVSWIQIRESADPSLDGARDRAKVLTMRVDALDPPPAPPAPRPPAPAAAFVAPPPAYAAARAALRKPPGRK
jgi:hypothetical protein